MQQTDDTLDVMRDAYMHRRANLVRFFTARLGSASAAEDLVQDIFVRLSSLKPIETIQNPAALLYRIGANLLVDNHRQAKRSAARDEAWRRMQRTMIGDAEITDEPSAENAAAARQRLEQLVEAVETLPPQMQRAFRLHKFDGLTYAETAVAMGISQSAVEKHISAALKALLARLK
jgi:RNA polymerase sigma factor (sigma-70 family)